MKKTLSIVLAAVLLVCTLGLASCGEASPKLPIVCGETGMNDLCGVATYGVDYYSLGVKAGDMAADVLLGVAEISTMPVQMDPNPTLVVNPTVAEEIGFTIPESVSSKATGSSAQKVTRATAAIVEDGADFEVGILQLVQHIALDQSNEGFVDQLSVRMSAAGKTVKIDNQNASNDTNNNITIANTFVSKGYDLIYTIATSSSQAATEATRESKIPVIFNAVTDPVSAGLVASMEAPGANVSGVSDINPVAKQIELIKELLGKDNIKVGLLYTAAETNSVFQINMAKAYCDANGCTYVDKGITDINDLRATIQALANEGVDAIYIPTDNAIANACDTVHLVNLGE